MMCLCVDYKTTFPDTHRHFRPAVEIARTVPVFCGGLELKKSNFQKVKMLGLQPMQYHNCSFSISILSENVNMHV